MLAIRHLLGLRHDLFLFLVLEDKREYPSLSIDPGCSAVRAKSKKQTIDRER